MNRRAFSIVEIMVVISVIGLLVGIAIPALSSVSAAGRSSRCQHNLRQMAVAAQTYAETCVVCHRISGEGGTLGPDLTLVGRRRNEAEIHAFIVDPAAMMGEPSAMPAFGKRLKPEQIDALAKYLASRQ